MCWPSCPLLAAGGRTAITRPARKSLFRPLSGGPLPAPAIVPRVFSGIQPSGVPHLGNYLGALRNWVTLQNAGELPIIYSVVG